MKKKMDAVSRGDHSRSIAEGWTRASAPVDEVMRIFGDNDIAFACHEAPERLIDAAVWFVPAPRGAWVRRAGAEVRTPARTPSFRVLCCDQTKGHCT